MVSQGAGASVLDNEQESDPYLISLVRGGDTAQSSAAFGKLYERHVDAARRLARVLVRDQSDTDDLVAETFTRVLSAMRAGRGPDSAFRAYLLTSLKHTLYDRVRRDRRIEFTDDLTPYERATTPDDPLVRTLESSYAARAFARLPERWRTVLWHTEVEGETPAQVAPLLGLTPNGVAALAYRARERLRQMYLQEHIDVTSSPRCHWTGTHLAGYVRAQLARRDRSKVEDHLAGCAECRSLHRELTEENSGLRGVLATLVLGFAAPGYLAVPALRTSSLAALAGVSVLLWQGLVDACAGFWGYAASLAVRLPRRLIERFGPGNVAAAGGLVAAGLAAVAGFAAMLISGGGSPIPAMPKPAPHQPPVAAPTASPRLVPPPSPDTSPPVLPPLPDTTGGDPKPPAPSSRPSSPGIASQTTGGPIASADPAAVILGAGGSGTLPITVRAAESAPAEAGSTALGLSFPDGMTLAGTDAGEGWRCTGDGDPANVVCERAGVDSSVARIPVSVALSVTGYQSIPVMTKVTTETGNAVSDGLLRVPVAPAGLRTGYAATGPLGFGLGGNTLLACQPRPACLAQDNNEQEMLPFLAGAREPVPPPGLAPDSTASGARIALPPGAVVRWAGLAVTGSAKLAPTALAVSGPGGGWQPVSPKLEDSGSGQAFADVTDLVRRLGGGDWWLAARTGDLPAGRGTYAGWSLAVAYELAGAPPGELAIYLGPRPLGEAQEVSVGLGEGGGVDLGMVLWDGDRGLGDDSLTLDATPIGDATNAGMGVNASNLLCALSPQVCAWRTPGIDVLRHKGPSSRGGLARLRSGNDPMTLGLMVVLAERQHPAAAPQ